MNVIYQIILMVLLILGIGLLMAFPTMWLWNWLMIPIFGLIKITFWQAFGLNILTGVFFRNVNIN